MSAKASPKPPAPATPTRFANVSDAMLADELGRIDEEQKAIDARQKDAREEMTRRQKWAIEGDAFVVTKSVIATMSIDTAGLRAEMGEDWVRGHSKPGSRTTYRIGRKGLEAPKPKTPRKRPAAKAAPSASRAAQPAKA